MTTEVTPEAKQRLLNWLSDVDPEGWVMMVRWCAGTLAKEDQTLLIQIIAEASCG